jgi:HK97 family phage major capsid protein
VANLFELKKTRAHATAKAESIVSAAENAHRELTASEASEFDVSMACVHALNPQIEALEKNNTLIPQLTNGRLLPGTDGGRRYMKEPQRHLSEQYAADFFEWIRTRGQAVGAALYEGGGGPAGGYLVPSIVADQVVPLAPPDMGVASIATVIPTIMDIKIPRAGTISTATIKAEGTGDASHLFIESEAVFEQFTLSAFMAGLQHVASWELLQRSSFSVLQCCGYAFSTVNTGGIPVCGRQRERTASGASR